MKPDHEHKHEHWSLNIWVGCMLILLALAFALAGHHQGERNATIDCRIAALEQGIEGDCE